MADDLLTQMQGLENRRIALTLSGDFDALAEVLSNSLLYGHSTGTLDSKASMLKLLREGTVEYDSIESNLDAAISLAPDIVVVSGLLTTCVKVLGQPRSLSGRYMAVWRQREGQWQLEALQGSNK
jgi:ketosteroid isomerase-like protein